jgi:hypothetical protein
VRTTLAEGQQVHARAVQVEDVGARDGALVAVAAREPERELVARPHRRTRHLDVAGRGASHVVDGRRPAQQLVERRPGQELGPFLQLHQRLRLLEEGQHRQADGLAGGLLAGQRQEQEEVVEVPLLERRTVDLAVTSAVIRSSPG